MIIPTFLNVKAVDNNGFLTDEFVRMFDELFKTLQQNLSNEGFKLPLLTTATISQLNSALSIGALVYDNDTNQLKVNINGSFKVVQTL